MSDRDREKIIRALFAAYKANDRKAVEDALTDNFATLTDCILQLVVVWYN